MASFELTQVKRENHPFHSNIFPFLPLYFPYGAGNSAPAVQANSLHVADGGNRCFRVPGIWLMFVFAGLAQLVEQLICNQSVIGSSPISSSRRYPLDVSKSHDTMLYTTSGGQHATH
jgi:hypothetical protein